MHTNLKAAISAVLSLIVVLAPGLDDVLHEAGGPAAVTTAVLTLNLLIHGVIHHFTSDTP